MPRYSTLFLDADNTLFDFSASQREALRDTLLHFSLPFSDEIEAYYDRGNIAAWKEYEKGNMTREDIFYARFRRLLSYLGEGPGREWEINDYYEKRLESSSILMPGALEFCRKVAGECRLCILTNGTASIQESRLALSPIKPYISRMFVSQSLGVQKPKKEFFDRVFARLEMGSTARAGVVMIGDSLNSDILGGMNAGLDTIWFNPKGLKNEEDIHPLYSVHSYEEIERLILGS